MTDEPAVDFELGGGIAVISLTRPEKRNAMRPADCQRIGDLVRQCSQDPAVRAVILTGAGGYFSAGADLRWNAGRTEGTLLPIMHRTVIDTYRCTKPVLAAVEGCCVGAAWAVALACDLVVAGAGAYFEPPFVSRGLVPDAGVAWFLEQRLGRFQTARLLWFDGRLDAGQAAALGLVTDIAEDGAALSRARELAARLAASPARTVSVSKAIVRNGIGASLESVLDAEFGHIAYNKADEEVSQRREDFVARLGRGR
ncbi:MAG TPA: enoyl-CoA hydratase/isomerase family protein [Streptosporangiaceae bacterium]|nr:enoyl-CoA hydratase/isomerase family protein [Streptosporangiaceae bacterium]